MYPRFFLLTVMLNRASFGGKEASCNSAINDHASKLIANFYG